MPDALRVLPCPFKVGDILRWKRNDYLTAHGLPGNTGNDPFVVASITDRITGTATGLMYKGITIRYLGGATIDGSDHFWPGFFELDPFLNAVKKRRNKP